MILTTREIKRDIKRNYYSRIRNLWFDQKRYYVPTIHEVAEKVNKQVVKDMPPINETIQCEAYGQFLWIGIKKELIDLAIFNHKNKIELTDNIKYTWSLGIAKGLNFKHMSYTFGGIAYGTGPHQLNFVYAQEGLYLIEPKSNRIIKATKAKRRKDGNFVYFMEM